MARGRRRARCRRRTGSSSRRTRGSRRSRPAPRAGGAGARRGPRRVSTVPYIIVAVVRHAGPVGGAHHVEPLVAGRLAGAITWRTRSTRISAPPPGSESWPGGAQAREGLVRLDPRDVGDVQDLRGRQGVQVDRVARLDVAEEVLVPLDPQVGVVAALQEQRGAAQVERLLDLAEDHRLRQDVALGVHGRPVEGAEVAVGDAEVGVVDVAVDRRTSRRPGSPVASRRGPRPRPRPPGRGEASSASASSSRQAPAGRGRPRGSPRVRGVRGSTRRRSYAASRGTARRARRRGRAASRKASSPARSAAPNS